MPSHNPNERSGYAQIDPIPFQSQEDLSRSPRRDSIPTVTSHAQDNMSINSAAPLRQQTNPIDTGYPPVSNPPSASLTPVHEPRVKFSSADSDVEATKDGRSYSQMPTPNPSGSRGHLNKSPSWDLLAGYRKFEHSYEEFDTRNASEKHLVFADGDVPNTAVSITPFVRRSRSHARRVLRTVRPILSLPLECFNRHSLAYFYHPCPRFPLDPWYPSLHGLPSW